MLLTIILFQIFPIYIPFVWSVFYGVKTSNLGLKRLFVWLALNAVIFFPCSMAAFYLLGSWCSVGGGSSCTFDFVANVKGYLAFLPFVTLLELPFMYLGVYFKNLKLRRRV